MMSLPDFKEKHILFIIADDIDINKVKFANDNICFVKNDKIENQVSCHKIFAVFIVGDCSLTTVFIKNCKKYGIPIFLMNRNFLTYNRLSATAEGNYLARLKQYTASDQSKFYSSKKLICNKIANQISLLENIKSVKIDNLKNLQHKIANASDYKDILGLEGMASKIFFKEYFFELNWYRRLPRTKTDPINLLMDIGYTFLFNFIDGMICLYGLDTYIGFYHRLFFQRKSLTCDLMEPFRSIIDKQILKSYHLNQINYKDFKKSKGFYYLDNKSRDKYLEIFTETIMNKKEEIFCYVRDYYYYLMNNSKFPNFKIN